MAGRGSDRDSDANEVNPGGEALSGAEATETPIPGVGVFHRINSIIPDAQRMEVIGPEVKASVALQMMMEKRYSQLPVVRSGEVLGSFSYRSFAAGVLRNQSKIPAGEIPVEEFLEDNQIAHASAELSSVYEALDRDDVVLVGSPDELQAVLTPVDVLYYLNSLSEPFVQLGEIEKSLRAVVRHSVTPEELDACSRRSLNSLYAGREHDLPTDVDEMTLGELISILKDGRNYTHFAGVLGPHRELFQAKMGGLSEIRNIVLHFKRDLEEQERLQLSEIRLWLLRKFRGSKVAL